MAEWMKKQLARLLVLPFGPEDVTEHERALSDIPEPVMTAAVDYALKTRTRFPVPSELRLDADKVAPLAVLDVPLPTQTRELDKPVVFELPEGLKLHITHEFNYCCDACSDTGWASYWCGDRKEKDKRYPWMPFGHCGRQGVHGNHEYVQRCMCYASNPVLIRKREAQRKYSEPPQKAA
jgi:hypothetical protein